MAECGSLRWGDFKPRLAEALVEHLTPIQINYERITEDPTYLDSVLAEGADKANESATRTLDNCRQAMGFTPRQVRT
jgi:tryptophanyl-tRNA synthetase